MGATRRAEARVVEYRVGPDLARESESLLKQIHGFRFVGDQPGRMLVRTLALGPVAIGTVHSVGHDIALTETDRQTFLLPLAGSLAVEAKGRVVSAAPGRCLMVGPGFRRTAVRAGRTAPFKAAVALAPAPRGEAAVRRRLGLACHPGEHAGAAALADHLRYLLQHMADADSPLWRPAAMAATSALIRDLFAAITDEPEAADRRPAGEARVRRAEEIMRGRCDEPLSLEEVAREVGVSQRVLQLAFRAHRGCSPRAVLTGMRLEQARARLLADAAPTNVTEAALASGFTHFGRFADAYRLRFGETPSQTLRRVRQ